MSKNLFNTIQLKAPNKNRFDLTHDVKLSCDMGELIPVCIFDCVPGDSFQIGGEALVRFAPLVSPVMHRFNVSIHYFFVPNRILWEGWEDWITNPNSTRVFPTSTNTVTSVDDTLEGTLWDYLGIGDAAGATVIPTVSMLPFAAYQAVYNEYYRDQNLISEIPYKLIDGPTQDPSLLTVRKRAWNHDYFTSALPFAQKGAAVDIPLGDVVLKSDNYTPVELIDAATKLKAQAGVPSVQPITGIFQDSAVAPVQIDPKGSLSVEATTITDLRRAFRLQEWLEMQARGGTRYTEQIRTQFNVISSDARLQRPEYITGVRSPIVISEVLNTTGSFNTDLEATSPPQGNMAGHGIGVVSGRHGSYFCEEHGYIIGIMSIMPETAYQQGVPKHFLKYQDQFQYYWPSFAHIGEQEIVNKELYIQHLQPDETFGYIPRYAEYKFINNRVAGDFKGNLDTWHAGRIFGADPNLNQEFIECVPTKRIFAVTDENVDSIYCHVLNRVSAVRPMPKYGNPYM